MKKLTPFIAIVMALLFSGAVFAQPGQNKGKANIKAAEGIEAKEDVKAERTQGGPPEHVIRHAEERSNGNAFSGKGNGKRHNRVDKGEGKAKEERTVGVGEKEDKKGKDHKIGKEEKTPDEKIEKSEGEEGKRKGTSGKERAPGERPGAE